MFPSAEEGLDGDEESEYLNALSETLAILESVNLLLQNRERA